MKVPSSRVVTWSDAQKGRGVRSEPTSGVEARVVADGGSLYDQLADDSG
jgi:hypothetical protein